MAKSEPLKMFKGDDEDIPFQVLASRNPDVAQNTTGWTFTFTVKVNDDDVSSVLSKSTGSGISAVDDATGQQNIVIDAADTAAITPGLLVYDIQATTDLAKIKTIAKGTFELLQDVT